MSYLLHELKNNISTITLDRPEKHNAFNDTVIHEFMNLIKEVNQNSEVRVIIIQASGHNFCAGADLNWMQQMANYNFAENEADAQQLAHFLQYFSTVSKPVIGLVHGHVLGGGVGLVACCDIVLAADNTHFCFSEVKLGLTPATIAPYIVRSIGYSAARRLFISAEKFDAQQALNLGLVHDVLPADQLLNKGIDLAVSLKRNGPRAMATTKRLVNDIAKIDDVLINHTSTLLAEIRTSQEGQNGLKAFLTKQTPDWHSSE